VVLMRSAAMLWLVVFAWICAIALVVFFGMVVFGENTVSNVYFLPAGRFHLG
jgi:hypothetical protein